MKTIEEIEIEVIDELGIIDYTNDYVHEVAQRYALEAIKADRERVSGITRIWEDEKHPNWRTLREAIRNLPYDLK